MAIRGGKIRTRGTVRRLPSVKRFATAHAFVGRRVELTRRYIGDDTKHVGEVVSVAWSPGAIADAVIVLRGDESGHDLAISLAQVQSIVEVD